MNYFDNIRYTNSQQSPVLNDILLASYDDEDENLLKDVRNTPPVEMDSLAKTAFPHDNLEEEFVTASLEGT